MYNSLMLISNDDATIALILMEFNGYYDINGVHYLDPVSLMKEFKKCQPDMLMFDADMDEEILLPDIQMIKNEKPELPMIAFGKFDNDREIRWLEFGVNDFLHRPFTLHLMKLRLDNQRKMLEVLNELKQLSLYDTLTKLPNRRFFDKRMNEISDISVAIADIDHFKSINDTYGHPVGDCVLKYVGDLLNKALSPEEGFVSRWGGEEFTCLLYTTIKEKAEELAERMRETIDSNKAIIDGGLVIHVSISVGVAVGPNDEALALADRALYVSKNGGRNRVTVFKE